MANRPPLPAAMVRRSFAQDAATMFFPHFGRYGGLRSGKMLRLPQRDGLVEEVAVSERGVIYVVWGGDDRTERALERSRRSLNAIHPELPVEVFRIKSDGPHKTLLQKSSMFEISPFRETLYLDADTVVLDRLDFAFLKAKEFGLACCICECPWARRYSGIRQGETVEYNTGVLFFCEQAKSVFEKWSQLAPEIDSSIIFLGSAGQTLHMSHNDQCSFALAIERTKFLPFVLPINWNFRPMFQLSFLVRLRYGTPTKSRRPSLRNYANTTINLGPLFNIMRRKSDENKPVFLSATTPDRRSRMFISRMSRGGDQRHASYRRHPRPCPEYKHTVALLDHQPRSEGPGGIL